MLLNLSKKIKKKYPQHYKFAEFLCKNQGVHILRNTDIPPKSQSNYPIRDHLLCSELTKKIIRYLNKGSLIGPFFKHEIPFDNYFLSPLSGLWKIYPNKVSLIQNLSAPFNHSINSCIPESLRETEYVHV